MGYENWEGIRHSSPRAYRLGFVCRAMRCVRSRGTPSSLDPTKSLPGDRFPRRHAGNTRSARFTLFRKWHVVAVPSSDISWPVINIQYAFCTDFGLRCDVIRSAVNLELRMLFVMAGCCEVVDELQNINTTPRQSIHACVNGSCNRIWPWTAGQCAAAATGAQEPPGLC